jgi:surfeit locus 1 family protein
MRRVPIVATLIVALAVATMIGLGLWQLLIRRPEKLAYIAQLQANPSKPPIAFPREPDESLLFRRASGTCVAPAAPRIEGAGGAGFRLIAECRSGMLVQLGTTRDPNARVIWTGGEVSGRLTNAPDQRSAITALFDRAPQRMLLVSDRPLAGLSPNPPSNVGSVSNPHLSYAFQWLFFATSAAVIYALALRRRRGLP